MACTAACWCQCATSERRTFRGTARRELFIVLPFADVSDILLPTAHHGLGVACRYRDSDICGTSFLLEEPLRHLSQFRHWGPSVDAAHALSPSMVLSRRIPGYAYPFPYFPSVGFPSFRHAASGPLVALPRRVPRHFRAKA
jgi:hypothetical protein